MAYYLGFNGLHHKDKYPIAAIYDLHPKTLADWLHVLTYVRNICAHHSRLWNRKLAIRPNLQGLANKQKLLPKNLKNDNFFVVLVILKQLIHANGNGIDWKKNIEQLITSVNNDLLLIQGMGLPLNWQTHGWWQ